jgi:hypothetical protein
MIHSGTAIEAVRRRLSRSDPPPEPPFVEGLLIGAMIGAAIAGSTLWRRWRGRQSDRALDTEAARHTGEG